MIGTGACSANVFLPTTTYVTEPDLNFPGLFWSGNVTWYCVVVPCRIWTAIYCSSFEIVLEYTLLHLSDELQGSDKI